MPIPTPIEIERIEQQYLDELYHFLKFVKRQMLEGLKTKERIKDDWQEGWNREDGIGKISS